MQRAFSSLVRRARLSVVQRRVMGAADVGLDRGAYVVLSRVREWEPVRPSQLAERLLVDMSTVSRHVSRLQEAGMLDRRPDTDDRRASVLATTAQGAAAVEAVEHAWREALATVLHDWSERDRVQLARFLERFANDLTRLLDP